MKRKLKILACSDLHGLNLGRLLKKKHKSHFDVLVVAGDLQGGGNHCAGLMDYEYMFVPMIRRLHAEGIETVLVPGNHDFYLFCENEKRLCQSGLHVLIDKEEVVCGLRFYGTPWCPYINGRWVYEAQEEELAKHFEKIPPGIDILISHSPPLGKGRGYFDVSTQHDARYWKHFGSKALLDRINLVRPKITICGHIHSGDHTPVDIGSTTVVNVSLLDEHYALSYSPTMIEVDDNKKMVVKFQKG